MIRKTIRILCLILSVCMIATLFGGCGSKTVSSSPLDGVIGENKNAASAKRKSGGLFDGLLGGSTKESAATVDGFASFDASADYESSAPVAPVPGYESEQIEAKAGTLTAGEWKDRENIDDWLEKTAQSDWIEELKSRGFYSNNVFPVHVTGNGYDVYNAEVKLLDDKSNVLYSARTDVKGMAYLFCKDSDLENVNAFEIGDKKVYISQKDLGVVNEIETDEASSVLKELDLMLMVDTTGSMGDELVYLQKELTDVVERVANNNADGKELSIRVSVNFYRDEGDEYVVKYFDFRDDISENVKLISEQSADGGGDFPEAVHTALDNAINGHKWRENAVKLCFLVLDAPPHTAAEIQEVNVTLLKAIKAAAEKGIRIIPVASSGVDRPTEVDCRSFAIMTGGTYVFLTDDSGVGYDHLEADVGEFTVEPLNDCMVRIICEYCGTEEKKTEPETTTEIPTEEQTTSNPNYPNGEYEPLTESQTETWDHVYLYPDEESNSN